MSSVCGSGTYQQGRAFSDQGRRGEKTRGVNSSLQRDSRSQRDEGFSSGVEFANKQAKIEASDVSIFIMSQENLLNEYANDSHKQYQENVPAGFSEAPLDIILPGSTELSPLEDNPSKGICFDGKADGSKLEDCMPLEMDDRVAGVSIPSQHLDIASSAHDEVRISLICKSYAKPSFQRKCLDAALGEAEDECCRKYGIKDPDFSSKKLMEIACNYILGMGTADGGSTSSQQLDIVSSPSEEASISLICNSPGNSYFLRGRLDAALKEVENECRRTYGIHDTAFSLSNLMEKVCNLFLDLNSDFSSLRPHIFTSKKSSGKDPCANDNYQRNSIIALPSTPMRPVADDDYTQDTFQNNSVQMLPSTSKKDNSVVMLPSVSNKYSGNGHSAEENFPGNSALILPSNLNEVHGATMKKIGGLKYPQSSVPHSADIVLNRKYPVYLQDLSRGLEDIEIPILIGSGTLEFPDFVYIKGNTVYNDAHVDFSLARISDDNHCADCSGDCLSSALPCACAGETGGEFAYTREGLLREEFLDQCIAVTQEPERTHKYYCQICPLENKNLQEGENVRPCRGHVCRKFIKECWSKCGCNKKKCGNRIVQRGIQIPLQVFEASGGKGWGLRTVNALKKGTFVCEYVGEVVTNQELYERNSERKARDERHTYPVLLDADWGSERILRDEEALCLDATEFGNCGRFINHRCCDANLIEIPVEVETPDHHYYHLAFFAARDIKPTEELTWDYGIEFDDDDHPIKAFKCKCGSMYCRNKKRRRCYQS